MSFEYTKVSDRFIQVSESVWVRASQIESVTPTEYNGMRRARVRMISGTEYLSSTNISVRSIMDAITKESKA